MLPIKEFEKRFREILEGLDEIRDSAEGDEADSMDELNAGYEDALFVIECIELDDEDRDEAFSDALDEFEDLIEEYKTLDVPGIDEIIGRLKMTVSLAKNNL